MASIEAPGTKGHQYRPRVPLSVTRGASRDGRGGLGVAADGAFFRAQILMTV
jgi:hypothetical protein